MENTSDFSGFEKMELTHQSRDFLKETAKWTKLLSILGFIGIGLMILFGIFFGTLINKISGNNPNVNLGSSQILLAVTYIVLALIYLMPVYYLYNFSVKMKEALLINNEDSLTAAFSNLKSHYKFIGIFMVIILSIYAMIFLFGVLGSTLF